MFLAKLQKAAERVKSTVEAVGGPPPEKSIGDIFFACVKEGDLPTVRRLVEQEHLSLRAQHKKFYGWTALHYAAEADNPEMIEYLVSQGAPLDLQAGDGSTALEWARSRNRRRAISTLEKLSCSAAGSSPEVAGNFDAAIADRGGSSSVEEAGGGSAKRAVLVELTARAEGLKAKALQVAGLASGVAGKLLAAASAGSSSSSSSTAKPGPAPST
eukprot:RCo012143